MFELTKTTVHVVGVKIMCVLNFMLLWTIL